MISVDESFPPLGWVASFANNRTSVTVGRLIQTDEKSWSDLVVFQVDTEHFNPRLPTYLGTFGEISHEGFNIFTGASAIESLWVMTTKGSSGFAETYASNSLTLLLARTDSYPENSDFFDRLITCVRGIHEQQTLIGEWESGAKLYRFSSGRISIPFNEKPDFERIDHGVDFGSYSEYTSSLEAAVRDMRIGHLMRPVSSQRLVCTISGGQDSTFVTAVVSNVRASDKLLGVNIAEARKSGDLDFSGDFADSLGIEVRRFERKSIRTIPFEQLAIFLGTASVGQDAVYLAFGEALEEGDILFTGISGEAFSLDFSVKGFSRFDAAGNGILEYRLNQGFRHVPLLTLFIPNSDAIRNISESEEMASFTKVMQSASSRPVLLRYMIEKGLAVTDLVSRRKMAIAYIPHLAPALGFFLPKSEFLSKATSKQVRRWGKKVGPAEAGRLSQIAWALRFLVFSLSRHLDKSSFCRRKLDDLVRPYAEFELRNPFGRKLFSAGLAFSISQRLSHSLKA
jgi:hypothetical protein